MRICPSAWLPPRRPGSTVSRCAPTDWPRPCAAVGVARTSTFSTSSHYALTWHFDFTDDDHASGVVDAHAELCIGGKTVRLALRYLDHYVRIPQGWVFQQRVLKFRYGLPFDAVAGGLDDRLRVRWPGTEPHSPICPTSCKLTSTAGWRPPLRCYHPKPETDNVLAPPGRHHATPAIPDPR